MSKKRIQRYRLMCILITLLLLVMGMRVEEVHADSPSAYPAFGTVSLQRVSGGREEVIYRDNSVLNQLENFTVLRSNERSSAGMRTAQGLAAFLVLITLLLKLLLQEKSVFLYAACENQYRRRTLEYIHHTDGKKA